MSAADAIDLPADIVLEVGWARVHRGHGLDADGLAADLRVAHGPPSPGQELCVEEVHLGRLASVRWCGDFGARCPREGELHAHWYFASPAANNEFTITRWVRPNSSLPVGYWPAGSVEPSGVLR